MSTNDRTGKKKKKKKELAAKPEDLSSVPSTRKGSKHRLLTAAL